MMRGFFFVASTIVCQIVLASPSTRRDHSRGYFDRDPDHSIILSSNEDHINHPPWWKGPNGNNKHKPSKPSGLFDYYEAFGINSNGHGYGSSEEEVDTSRSPVHRAPGYGRPNWWRPPLPTTERPTPTEVPNPNHSFLAICIRGCPVNVEYNPICGSDNVTYRNPGQLECAQYCGVAVTFVAFGSCSTPEEVTAEVPSTEEAQAACMRSCPVTGEYNPVCGSNNVTYSNPGRLECAQNCGVLVTLSRLSACSASNPSNPVSTSTNADNVLSIGELTAVCMRSCPVTSEFNPVCGTNNVTYTNPGRLECAQKCGVEVQLGRHTSCEALITEGEGNNNAVTTELNFISTTSSTTTRPFVNTNGEGDWISGNNDITTNNNTVGNNLSGNGENNNTPLSTDDNINNSNEEASNFYNETANGKDNNLSDEENGFNGDKNTESKGKPGMNNGNNCIANNRKPPSVKEVMECMQTCSLTSESNPICGTDSITYMNPGRLLCAQFCGVDVKVKKFAPCNSTGITNVHCLTPCTNPPIIDNSDAASIDGCLEACPASLEFQPVCGSNNITYRNLEKLQCARRCGIDVTFIRNSHCSIPEIKPDPTSTIQDCIGKCSVPHKYDPICGTDNVTYNNTGHLICARQCGLDIAVKQLYPCGSEPNVSPTSSSSTTTENAPTMNPGNNSLNFTIDPAILASIWSEVTSTTPKDDEDEDFELDQRVKDKTK